MTKKLFLAAASVAALAFAGAAQAGTISGYFGTAGVGNNFSAAVGNTPAVTYQVASEKTVSASVKATGTIFAAVKLDTPIVVAAGGATRDYLVAFTVSGATVKSATPSLILNVDVDGTGTFAVADSATLVSNTNGVVTYLVSVSAGEEAHAFQLVAGLEQTAQAPVTVSSTVTAVIGGSNILVDSAPAALAAKYAPALKAVSATANSLEALLATTPAGDDYVFLDTVGATGGVLANAFEVLNTGAFNTDLNGTDATPTVMLDTAVLTVKGPAINEEITVDFGIGSDGNVAATPANTQVVTLTAAENVTFSAGATDLSIDNTGDAEYAAGDYTVTWATKLKSGFTAPAASTTAAGTITLEGTNFVAPWVSGTGAATSVIRVSNSNAAASVPVTVRMISGTQVVNGVATPFVSTAAPLVVGSVPANGDLQVTSSQLTAHFGAFTRGDFRVTVNQPETGLVAKLRNTRDGQTFEQSLAD